MTSSSQAWFWISFIIVASLVIITIAYYNLKEEKNFLSKKDDKDEHEEI